MFKKLAIATAAGVLATIIYEVIGGREIVENIKRKVGGNNG